MTIFYAWATYHILKANKNVVALMQEQLDALSRPYVVVTTFIRPGTPLIYLRVQNSGKMPASRLRLSIDKDFYQMGQHHEGQNLAKFAAFTQPFDCFAPDASLEFLLGRASDIFSETSEEAICPKVFCIKVDYSYEHKQVSEATAVDLRPFARSDIPRHIVYDGLNEVSAAIKELVKEVRQWRSSFESGEK